jgi:hypothetical protein
MLDGLPAFGLLIIISIRSPMPALQQETLSFFELWPNHEVHDLEVFARESQSGCATVGGSSKLCASQEGWYIVLTDIMSSILSYS